MSILCAHEYSVLPNASVVSNVRIVRTMISTHPFNTWPLHVKIFTEEVANQWRAADADGRLPLPLGFTYTVELEGVDGQSGHPGSGRKGPISVDDGQCFHLNTRFIFIPVDPHALL